MPRHPPAPLGSSPLVVPTDDGVQLRGWHLPAHPSTPGGCPPVFVLAHGFTNSVARARLRRLAGWLRPFGDVRALDFRGHGASGGASAVGGDPELRETPLLLVHGDEDSYFPLEMFRSPVRAAGPAAEAWVVPGMGHAESGMTAPLVERIGRWASESIQG